MPAEFRFSVKLPKTITHERKLVDCDELVLEFAEQVGGLGDKLAILLVQLPPKLEFDRSRVATFFRLLSTHTNAQIVCEPRNASWFAPAAEASLHDLQIARAAADPALVPAASRPGGWKGVSYWRLHGSPLMYRSSYADRIELYANMLRAERLDGDNVWCIFDNTASSAATSDARSLVGALGASSPQTLYGGRDCPSQNV